MVFGLLDLIVSKSVCALMSLPYLYIIFYGYVCSFYGIVVNDYVYVYLQLFAFYTLQFVLGLG